MNSSQSFGQRRTLNRASGPRPEFVAPSISVSRQSCVVSSLYIFLCELGCCICCILRFSLRYDFWPLRALHLTTSTSTDITAMSSPVDATNGSPVAPFCSLGDVERIKELVRLSPAPTSATRSPKSFHAKHHPGTHPQRTRISPEETTQVKTLNPEPQSRLRRRVLSLRCRPRASTRSAPPRAITSPRRAGKGQARTEQWLENAETRIDVLIDEKEQVATQLKHNCRRIGRESDTTRSDQALSPRLVSKNKALTWKRKRARANCHSPRSCIERQLRRSANSKRLSKAAEEDKESLHAFSPGRQQQDSRAGTQHHRGFSHCCRSKVTDREVGRTSSHFARVARGKDKRAYRPRTSETLMLLKTFKSPFRKPHQSRKRL